MCIIAICEDRALTRAEFDRCWDSNPQGMGYARWNGRRIFASKGHMKKGGAWEVYKDVPLPHVVHFRIRSAGEIIEELTHPFIVSADSPAFKEISGNKTVLFHNGTVSDWKSLLVSAVFQTKIYPEGAMSDSRAMAVAVSVAGLGILNLFDSMKWVVVNKNGFSKFGTWVEDKKVLFSNEGFRVREAVTYGDWTESRWSRDSTQQQVFPISKWRKPAWKSCSNCIEFEESEGYGMCGQKGKLKDRIACKEFMAREEAAPEEAGRGCGTCVFRHRTLEFCQMKGIGLENDAACYDYKPMANHVITAIGG